MAYRPIDFDGTFSPSRILLVAMSFGGGVRMPVGDPVVAGTRRPAATRRTRARAAEQDGLPDIEVLDVRSGRVGPAQHLQIGASVRAGRSRALGDPASGEVQVEFVNERQTASASSSG